MSRKMKFFHQLDEKTAETFLAHVHCEVLYIVYLHVQANRQWLLKLSLWFVVGRCYVSFSSMLLCCALCNPMPLQSEAKVIGCSSQFTGSHCSVMMSVKHLLLCLCLIMMMIGHKCDDVFAATDEQMGDGSHNTTQENWTFECPGRKGSPICHI